MFSQPQDVQFSPALDQNSPNNEENPLKEKNQFEFVDLIAKTKENGRFRVENTLFKKKKKKREREGERGERERGERERREETEKKEKKEKRERKKREGQRKRRKRKKKRRRG